MSAPGASHELRRGALDTMAIMAGFTASCRLGEGLQPDVVRADLRRAYLLVGEAKDTETPGTAATAARYTKYAHEARRWLRAGFTVVLAICHGDTWLAADWASFLAARAAACGGRRGAVRTISVDDSNVITWTIIHPDDDGRAPTLETRTWPADQEQSRDKAADRAASPTLAGIRK
jgi:hypothetical protein